MQEFKVERYDAALYLVDWSLKFNHEAKHGDSMVSLPKLTDISHYCDITHFNCSLSGLLCGWQLNAML